MTFSTSRFSNKDFIFILCLVLMICIYAMHLLTFTLFEGFTTLSNDSGGYVILARKWSPFFVPDLAEIRTWPTHVYPPGFPWALALFGASETLYAGHFFVSVCMLASMFLVGWMAYRELGWLIGGMITAAFFCLPGVVFSSMGILSENLYLLLSLAVLLLFSSIRKKENASPANYLLLLMLLAMAILTRSIGIALIGAIAMVVIFDGNMVPKRKIAFALTVLSSIALWQLWGFLNPQRNETGYTDLFAITLNHAGPGLKAHIHGLWNIVSTNLVQIISSWNHYLSLSDPNVHFFVFSTLLLIFCLIGLGYRFCQRAPDAIYVTFYLVILTVWPYPQEMTRFLHPVIFLIILQPALFFMKVGETRHSSLPGTLVLSFTLVLFVNSLIVQNNMLELQKEAASRNPNIIHSLEYYAPVTREEGELFAMAFYDVMQKMSESSEHLPKGSLVASVKHEFYTVLSGLASVNLVGIVPLQQQLCNLKIKNVDAVFFSNATTKFNPHGVRLHEDYLGISDDKITWGREDGGDIVHLLKVDKTRLDSALDEAGGNCLVFEQH